MNSKISKLAARIQKDPRDSFSKFALALELLKIGEQQRALTLFRNILENDPDYVGVYYHLGKLHEDLGENNLALEIYNKGIAIATEQRDTHSASELQGAKMNLEFEINDPS